MALGSGGRLRVVGAAGWRPHCRDQSATAEATHCAHQHRWRPQVVGYASPNYTPGQAEIRYFLKHWVELVRTVPLDPVVVKSAWSEAYSFMTPASANKLNAEARVPGSTMSKVGQETVTTQVTSVVPVSADSYQVRWVETSFTDQGQVKERATWTSTFTIKQSTPDPKVELVNPLGLFITDFNWQRDIGSAP